MEKSVSIYVCCRGGDDSGEVVEEVAADAVLGYQPSDVSCCVDVDFKADDSGEVVEEVAADAAPGYRQLDVPPVVEEEVDFKVDDSSEVVEEVAADAAPGYYPLDVPPVVVEDVDFKVDDSGEVVEEVAADAAPGYQPLDVPSVVEEDVDFKLDDSGHVVKEVAADAAPEYHPLDVPPVVEEDVDFKADDSGQVVEVVAADAAPEYRPLDVPPVVKEEEEAGASGIQITRTPLTADSFEFYNVLGEGAFGKVYLASRRANDQLLAIKMVKKRLFLEKEDPEFIFSERHVLKTLRKGPFISQLYATFQSPHYLFFAMEYLSGGTLMSVIRNTDQPFDVPTLRLFAAQMVIGLEYIHSKGVIHRDVKPGNILLDAVGNIKIADFGLAVQKIFEDNMTRGYAGTLNYMAPEVFLEMDYEHSIDYFSMGVMLFKMACSKHPFIEDETDDEEIIMYSIVFNPAEYPPEMDTTLKNFLRKLLSKRQEIRKHLVKNLREEPLFISIDWNEVESGKVQAPFHVEPPREKSRRPMTAFEVTYSQMMIKPRIPREKQELFKSFSFASEGW
ncbi:protein kinase C theta type-like [Hyperolius riggenbachi]|uniref:protein kinase C theta type-like n=1 Tax=Hyperolius riggenbachi TaxID=752182 RepID=UPI0035A2AA73